MPGVVVSTSEIWRQAWCIPPGSQGASVLLVASIFSGIVGRIHPEIVIKVTLTDRSSHLLYLNIQYMMII